jgi:hypothetical protein
LHSTNWPIGAGIVSRAQILIALSSRMKGLSPFGPPTARVMPTT